MKLSEAYPSIYLKAQDLQGNDVPVVIASAEIETVGSERKLVLTFQNKKKSMICNKTNGGRIAYLYGDETEDWIGKEIVLTSEFVEFQGKTVEGLRVKPPVKRGPAPAAPSPARERAMQSHQAPPPRNMEPPPRDDMDSEIPF